MTEPAQLNRDEIAARIPHAGRMVLLDAVVEWDEERIVCIATSHRDPHNPLAVRGRLAAICAIEYAAQAMAVHGGLLAPADAAAQRPRSGFLASLRGVRIEVGRLDDIAGALVIQATRLSGDDARVLYSFSVGAGDRILVTGRAAVVLDAGALMR